MRLPYTPNPPVPASDAEAAIISRITARRAPRPLQPLDLTLLHSPPVADGWNSFLGAIRTQTSSIPTDAREVAICRVAVINEAWYEWGHHAPLALAAGVSEEGMRTVREGSVSWPFGKGGEMKAGDGDDDDRVKGLDGLLWAVLVFADESTRNVKVKDETFNRVREIFGDKGAVELTAIVAAYNCVSRFLVALDVGERNGTSPDDNTTHH